MLQSAEREGQRHLLGLRREREWLASHSVTLAERAEKKHPFDLGVWLLTSLGNFEVLKRMYLPGFHFSNLEMKLVWKWE